MIIYAPDHSIIYNGDVSDESYRYKAIMKENALTLKISHNGYIEIPVGSYTVFKNEVYFLWSPENFTKVHTRNYEYTLIMEGYYSLLKTKRFKFFTRDSGGNIEYPYKLKGWYTGTPKDFLDLIVSCMNDSDSNWYVGDYIVSEQINIEFNHENCMEVLQKIAEAFKTEWYIEGKIISLGKVSKMEESPTPLKYGKDGGFKSGVKRDNGKSERKNRLYVQGGSKNIDRSKYGGVGYPNGSDVLLLPKNSSYTYKGIEYVTDEYGLYIERADKRPSERVIEGSLEISDIYPMREGEVKGVIAVDDANAKYDIIDSNIPEDLNYNNYRIDQEMWMIAFHSGDLSGHEFEIQRFDKGENRFELVAFTDAGRTLPKSPLIPRVGDKYAVFNISMPVSYNTDAEQRMFVKAVEAFHEENRQKFSFEGQLDGIYAKNNWLNLDGKLDIGYYVDFSDDQFLTTPESIRIVGVKEYINTPYKPTLELSNEISVNSWANLVNEVKTSEVKVERSSKSNYNYTQRRWRDLTETMDSMYDPEGDFFDDLIRPLYIQTMQLVTGTESLQFDFMSSDWNNVVDFDFTFHTEGVNKGKFSISTSYLKHYTIDVEEVKESRPEAEYKHWLAQSYLSAILDPEKPYYVYVRCGKTFDSTSGIPIGMATFLLSETPVSIDQESGYYHLWVGFLNSEYSGNRSFKSMYGYSETLPGQMTASKFASPDGRQYLDFLNGLLRFGKFSGNDLVSGVDIDSNRNPVAIWKGGMVQSPSGDMSPMPVDRGSFDIGKTYYPGDLVQYNGSTYTCINETISTPPTDISYWKILASKGEDGEGRIFSFQGVYDNSNTYNGDSQFAQVVRYNIGTSGSPVWQYFYTKKDAGSFSGVLPTDTSKWESYGASFESIATGLAFIDKALIAGFDFYNQVIRSTKTVTVGSVTNPAMTLDGINGFLRFISTLTRYTSSGSGQTVMQETIMDSASGQFISKTSDNDTSWISSQGIFSNKAGVNPYPASTGLEALAGIVSLGRGNLAKNAFGGLGFIAGVYGRASNSNGNPAPAYGGYFHDLMVNGLHLSASRIDSNYTAKASDSYISCYNLSGIVLNLLSNPNPGRVYYIRVNNNNHVRINGNGIQIMEEGGSLVSEVYATTRGELVTVMYDGQYWLYSSTAR